MLLLYLGMAWQEAQRGWGGMQSWNGIGGSFRLSISVSLSFIAPLNKSVFHVFVSSLINQVPK